jgi:hypothetical protein
LIVFWAAAGGSIFIGKTRRKEEKKQRTTEQKTPVMLSNAPRLYSATSYNPGPVRSFPPTTRTWAMAMVKRRLFGYTVETAGGE